MTYPPDQPQYPYQDESPQPPPAPRPRRWPLVVAAVALIVVTAAVSSAVTAAVIGSQDAPEQVAAQEDGPTALVDARSHCASLSNLVVIGDDGYSLSISRAAAEEGVSLPYDKVECILRQIEVPDAVNSRIGDTRALDGTQEAEWDDFYATWTYHPDSGLNMVIEQRR